MSLTTFMTIVMATVGIGALVVVVADHIPTESRVVRSVDEQLDRPRPHSAPFEPPVVYVDPPVLRRPPAHLLVLDETPRSIPRPEVTHG